jgi:pyruvate/2-oxoglutarate/acetoin dehydrogenase E1 component
VCVIDLRTVAPLDRETIMEKVSESERMLVVDEDYKNFGLSGELAATVMEAGISAKFRRVCTETTIPYSRRLEDETLPSTEKILDAALALLEE